MGTNDIRSVKHKQIHHNTRGARLVNKRVHTT